MVAISDITYVMVYKDKEKKHAVNQVNVKQLKNGDVVMVFNEERGPIHADTGQTCLIRSKDGGMTWDPSTKVVVLPYNEYYGNWDCGLAQLSDGTLIVNVSVCAYFKPGIIDRELAEFAQREIGEEQSRYLDLLHREFILRGNGWVGTVVLKSRDNGYTWSHPIPVNARPLKHAGNRLGVLELPNKTLLLGVYGRITGYGEAGEYETSRAALLRSDDYGDNWEYYSTIAYDPASILDFTEPALVRLEDGRLLCMLRVEARPSRRALCMMYTISENDGEYWSRPKPTNIWGYPAEIIPLQDGRYLMVYGYRRSPWGVRGCISEDGVTWDVKNEFIIRKGGVAPPKERLQYWHIGYPSCCQLKDGAILVAYHVYSDDKPSIQYTECAIFELKD